MIMHSSEGQPITDPRGNLKLILLYLGWEITSGSEVKKTWNWYVDLYQDGYWRKIIPEACTDYPISYWKHRIFGPSSGTTLILKLCLEMSSASDRVFRDFFCFYVSFYVVIEVCFHQGFLFSRISSRIFFVSWNDNSILSVCNASFIQTNFHVHGPTPAGRSRYMKAFTWRKRRQADAAIWLFDIGKGPELVKRPPIWILLYDRKLTSSIGVG